MYLLTNEPCAYISNNETAAAARGTACIRGMLKKPLNQPQEKRKNSYCLVAIEIKQGSRMDSTLCVETNMLVMKHFSHSNRCMVIRRQHDTTDTSSAATMEIWQHKMIINIDCKHQVLCLSLRTKGSLCFRAIWKFSKRGGQNPLLQIQTFQHLQKLQRSRGLLKGILGNIENQYLMYEFVEQAQWK